VKEMDDNHTPVEADTATEAAVLGQLLDLHPVLVTLDELVREIIAGAEDFAARDAVERAVRDLAAAGLLHRNGDLVLPSRAALRLDELLS
jgi:hypothetical protein